MYIIFIIENFGKPTLAGIGKQERSGAILQQVRALETAAKELKDIEASLLKQKQASFC